MCSKYWCFTLNNPELHHPLPNQWNSLGHKLSLLVFQYEIGEQNTEHIQGYVEFISRKKIATLKKINSYVHWDKRRGNREQAIAYCTKENTRKPDTVPFQWPSKLPEKEEENKANEYDVIKIKLQQGTSLKEIADEHFRIFLRSNRALKEYESLCKPPRNDKTTVIVIYGPTGTGKSRWCHDHFPNAYWKSKNEWWDYYNSQDCVVIDEFYGWFKYDYFLRLLDRYPFITEFKGGSKDFNSKLIIITSNKHPNEWYKKFDSSPMFRRFDHVWEFAQIGEDPIVHHGDHPNTFISNCTFAVQQHTLFSDEVMEEEEEEVEVLDNELLSLTDHTVALPPPETLLPVEERIEDNSQMSLTDLFREDSQSL